MVFSICLIILFLAIIGCKVMADDHYDWSIWVGAISIVYIVFWLLIHTGVAVNSIYAHSSLWKTDNIIKYEQLEANKDNDYLIQDIIEWNQDVEFYQKYQKDFWIGPYIPNVYDDFKTIEVK